MSKYEPLSILPSLSSEFDFISKEILHNSWNVSQIIHGIYHENVIIALDYFLDSVLRNDPIDVMMEAAHCTLNQLKLVIEDIKAYKEDKNKTSILEMAIEIQKIIQLWLGCKHGNSSEIKQTLDDNKQRNKSTTENLSSDLKMKNKLNSNNINEEEEDKNKVIEKMKARTTRQQGKCLWTVQDFKNSLKDKNFDVIFGKMEMIQNVSKKLKSQFRYNLDKNLINYNIFSFQNLLVKNHKNYNNLRIDRIYQEIQKWNVLEHKRKLYNNLKANRIYKENLSNNIIEYIIINIYKNKKTRRNMSYDLRKESFRNLIDPKKSDNNQIKRNEELNSYRVQLVHFSNFGNEEQLESIMKDPLFLELNEEERIKYQTMLKKFKNK